MKIVLKILLVFLSLCMLPGCGQKKTYRIGVSQCSSDDWRSKMNEEIEREMMTATGRLPICVILWIMVLI